MFLILKVAKTLRGKGYHFSPWYDSEWEENDEIIKAVYINKEVH